MLVYKYNFKHMAKKIKKVEFVKAEDAPSSAVHRIIVTLKEGGTQTIGNLAGVKQSSLILNRKLEMLNHRLSSFEIEKTKIETEKAKVQATLDYNDEIIGMATKQIDADQAEVDAQE